MRDPALSLAEQAANGGLRWIAAELATLAQQAKLKLPGMTPDEAAAFYRETGLQPLTNIVRRMERWETALEAMTRLQSSPSNGPSQTQEAAAPAGLDTRL